MIPIVEDYLTELMQSKLDYLKKNPLHLNKILGTSQNRIDRLANYISTSPIKITKGYPRTPAELPCICIMLQGEEETQEGLGNYGDGEDEAAKSYSEGLVVVGIESNPYMPHIILTHKPIVNVSEMIHNEFSIELDDTDFSVVDAELGILRIENPNVEIGDTITVSYTFKESGSEGLSVLYDANYRLEVWTLNGDLTVEMYHILKWMLISGRDFLADEKDLFSQRLSGADFQPAPSFFPEFVYRRAVSFWCQFTASTPIEDMTFPYISGVVETIAPMKPYDGGDLNGN